MILMVDWTKIAVHFIFDSKYQQVGIPDSCTTRHSFTVLLAFTKMQTRTDRCPKLAVQY